MITRSNSNEFQFGYTLKSVDPEKTGFQITYKISINDESEGSITGMEIDEWDGKISSPLFTIIPSDPSKPSKYWII